MSPREAGTATPASVAYPSGMPPTGRHRELLSAIALVLVPTLIVSMVVRILVAGDDATILNSHLLVSTPLDASKWIDFAITTLGWLWALTTGVLVMTGTLRDKEVCPTAAARQALRSLPTITFVLLIFAGLSWAALQILAAMWLLLLAGLVVAVVVLARAMMVVPTTALRLGAFWQVSSGRVTGVVLSVLLGVALPAVVAGWVVPFARDVLTEGGLPGGLFFGFVAEVLDAIVFLLVVAIQASTLARVCTNLLEDFTATDQTLDELGTSQLLPRWRAALAAGLAVPALISVGVVVADPYDRPTVRVNEMSLDTEVVAVAWPAGQHPIIIVSGGFLDCQDDECRDYQLHNEFATTVTRKGDVLAAGAMQSGEITIRQCTRSGQCQSGKLSGPGRASWPLSDVPTSLAPSRNAPSSAR